MLPIYLALLSDPDKADLFEEIYQEYRYKLYSCINGKLKNHHDSEEVLQETFIHIAENIHKVESAKSYNTRGYVFMIARNLTFNKLNRDIPKHSHENIDDFFNLRSSDDIMKTLEINEKTQRVFEIVNSMPEIYRSVFYLYYIWGYSTAAIAKMHGEKADTVKTRFVRLNRKLRKYIKEEFEL